MRKTLISAFAATTMLSSGAMAADLPARVEAIAPGPAPVFVAMNWSGFYIGANAGYAWGQSDVRVTHLPTQAGFNANPYINSTKPDGWFGGVQVGYNIQSGSLVYGLELDGQFGDIQGSRLAGPLPLFGGAPLAGSFSQQRTRMDAFGTLRGRIGVAFDRALIYVTGGGILGNVRDFNRSQYAAGNQFNYIASGNEVRFGYTVGAGLEYAFSGNWSAKIEYLYYDLGDRTIVANPVAANPPFATRNRFDMDGHLVRVGLNYRFGGRAGPVVAAY